MKPFFRISMALVLSALASPAAPVAIDPQVMRSDQEFLANQATESVGAERPALSDSVESTAPATADKSAPPIAAPPIAAKGNKVSRAAPKAKATPTPSSRIASRKREVPPATMAEVTVAPDYARDQGDDVWDRARDRNRDFDRDRDWERDRDYDRPPEEWRDRPRHRSDPSEFSPEEEVPRKVLHIRRFIHRLLPF